MEGLIADEISGLRNEIVALRLKREEMMAGLARQTRDRRKAVAGMCAGFGRDLAGLVRRTRADRTLFLDGLRRSVAGCRRAVRHDLAAARAAWTGRGVAPTVLHAPPHTPPAPKKKHQGK